mmetsp:Transcript_17352/g.53762  ORF Transcript_17352/g.53762 Transcript_17352/m.53762 type:complete len:102 (+) Transcript_17352:623-928(+)
MTSREADWPSPGEMQQRELRKLLRGLVRALAQAAEGRASASARAADGDAGVWRLAGHAVAVGRAAGRPAADTALPTAHHGAHAADQRRGRAAAIVYSRLPS